MVVKLLIDLVLGVPRLLLSLLPDVQLPAQLVGTGPGTLLGGIQSVASSAGSFDAWVPMGAAVQAVGFLLLCVGFAMVVRVVRILASFATGGGGSAA